MRKPLSSPVDVAVPDGWRSSALHDPFEAHVGPLFERGEDGERLFAFIVDERHVGEDGTVHEGMMLTFADAFLGSAAHRGADGKTCVTLSLQASFLKGAKPGDLVVCLGAGSITYWANDLAVNLAKLDAKGRKKAPAKKTTAKTKKPGRKK